MRPLSGAGGIRRAEFNGKAMSRARAGGWTSSYRDCLGPAAFRSSAFCSFPCGCRALAMPSVLATFSATDQSFHPPSCKRSGSYCLSPHLCITLPGDYLTTLKHLSRCCFPCQQFLGIAAGHRTTSGLSHLFLTNSNDMRNKTYKEQIRTCMQLFSLIRKIISVYFQVSTILL
jgi:hypothetical protein